MEQQLTPRVTDRLLQANGYFSQHQPLFDSIEKNGDKLAQIERFRQGSTLTTLLGVAGFLFYCWKIAPPMANSYFEGNFISDPLAEFLGRYMGPGWVVLIALVVAIALFFLIFFAAMVLVALVISTIKDRMTAPAKKAAESALDSTMEQLFAAYQGYAQAAGDDCPVPFDRCHPVLIRQLMGMIQSGRADTVKEAINLVLQDEHNQRMEQMSAQQLGELRQANSYLRQIEKNTSWTAWNTMWR